MSGSAAPAKPWERKGTLQGGTSSASPLGPSTANDGAAKPWETAGTSTASRSRPWDNQASSSGYGLGSSYNSYGAGGYGSNYGGYNSGSAYGRPAFGSNYGSYGGYSNYPSNQYGGYGMGAGSYGGGYGGYGSSYGSALGSSYGGYGGNYGGLGNYRSGFGMGAYGGGPYSQGSQLGPDGLPPQPPSAWQHMLHAISGVVGFFGRISFLVDENAHAFHFFISALLQLLDRGGSLYGELARFVLRLLGFRGKSRETALQPQRPPGHQGPLPGSQQLHLPGVAPPAENFDNVWKS